MPQAIAGAAPHQGLARHPPMRQACPVAAAGDGVARDAGLEELLREDLRSERGLTETPMFGGLAWLLRGNLLCGARQDGMLLRLGRDRDGWALALPDIAPMRMGARRMQGWVRVGPAAYGDDALRRRLLDAALDFVRALPGK